MSRIKDWIESEIERQHEIDSLDDPDMMVDSVFEDESDAVPETLGDGPAKSPSERTN